MKNLPGNWCERKIDDLAPKFEMLFNRSSGDYARRPKGLDYLLQGHQLLDEMASLFKKSANLHKERISQGQDEVYVAMRKLSDTELDCILVSQESPDKA